MGEVDSSGQHKREPLTLRSPILQDADNNRRLNLLLLDLDFFLQESLQTLCRRGGKEVEGSSIHRPEEEQLEEGRRRTKQHSQCRMRHDVYSTPRAPCSRTAWREDAYKVYHETSRHFYKSRMGSIERGRGIQRRGIS